MKLYEALKIKKGVTSVIGAGGKTTLINNLSTELSHLGTVVISTSTHIYPPIDYQLVTTPDAKLISDALEKSRVICIGKPCENQKLTAPDISFEELSKLCDYLLVEADGSKHLPLKAHRSNEPVIPSCSDRCVLVIGADCIGKKSADVVHRAQIFCKICSCEPDDIVTVEKIAELINTENLHDIVFVNKADELSQNSMKELSRLINTEVIFGELKKEKYYACID